MADNPEVDAYIDRAAPFAQPILCYLRRIVAKAEPDAQEALRWGVPFWLLDGRQLCGMGAFKAHCVFIVEGEGGGDAMGDMGRITALADLPDDAAIIALVRGKAARIRSGEDAANARRKTSAPKPELPMPDDLAQALSQSPQAAAVFAGFTAPQRRDYIEWITSAKREATRAQRVATAVEWIGEGKRRNWKYENC